MSEPYQLRMALVRARVFEEMKGLSGQVKADMARILTDGIARGLNPREVARNLTNQAGIETRRANRIARTEIPSALRRARLDEADEAKKILNLETREIHISALSPTTRANHAARHGKMFTSDE
ncbi:TPA: phage minor head protein, partial [Proteus mirabilis]